MNTAWQMVWVDSAEKDFLHLNHNQQSKISKHFTALLQNPFYGPQIKKLRGELEGLYRYRVGGLRIIYRVLAREKTIRIVALGTRGGIY